MPHNDAIGSEHLDGRYSSGAEQPLKTIQRALAFEHQAHNRALRRIISLHRSGT